MWWHIWKSSLRGVIRKVRHRTPSPNAMYCELTWLQTPSQTLKYAEVNSSISEETSFPGLSVEKTPFSSAKHMIAGRPGRILLFRTSTSEYIASFMIRIPIRLFLLLSMLLISPLMELTSRRPMQNVQAHRGRACGWAETLLSSWMKATNSGYRIQSR